MPSRLAVRGKNGAIYGRYDKDKRSECTDREKYSRLEKAAQQLSVSGETDRPDPKKDGHRQI